MKREWFRWSRIVLFSSFICILSVWTSALWLAPVLLIVTQHMSLEGHCRAGFPKPISQMRKPKLSGVAFPRPS
jgi:hypothetical protein